MTGTSNLSAQKVWNMLSERCEAVEILQLSSPKFLTAAREAIAGKSICPVNALIEQMDKQYCQLSAADKEVLNFFKYVANSYKSNPGAALLQLEDFVEEMRDADSVIIQNAEDLDSTYFAPSIC